VIKNPRSRSPSSRGILATKTRDPRSARFVRLSKGGAASIGGKGVGSGRDGDHGAKPSRLDISVNCSPILFVVHFKQHKKKFARSAMKRGVGDDPLRLTTKKRETGLIISEGAAQQKRATSELFFVECRRQSIDTETTDVMLIYLSFTNADVSIALPGGGVTLEGGANGTSGCKLSDH
jgi:hypothetical protein